MGQNSYKRIEAVAKTLEIIECLAHQKEPVTVQAVAEAVKLAQGTVMCHLVTLEDGGIVRQVGGCYFLGMRLAVYWARKKSFLEGELEQKQKELESISIPGGE